MKTETYLFEKLNQPVTYYIGKNANDNVEVIEKSVNSSDLWFHAKDMSSCHVVAVMPYSIDKKQLRYIIKKGAILCKQHTLKLASIKNLEIIYTTLSNVKCTNIPGQVITQHVKTITI